MLDPTFNPTGTIPGAVTTQIATAVYDGEALAIAIQSDGKIVAVGDSKTVSGWSFALARY